MAGMEYLAWMGAVACAGASFFFALAESALFSLGKWRAQQLSLKTPAAGARVVRLLGQPHELLATLVLGSAFANAGFIGTALWLGLHEGLAGFAAACVALVTVLIGCEVIPKTLAVRNAEFWSLRLAAPLTAIQRLAHPLRVIAQHLTAWILVVAVPRSVKPAPGLSDDEYQELIEMAHQQGALGKSERDIILQIIRLDRRTVHEVMKPRTQMACISDELSIEEMLEEASRYRHARLPIYDETPDTIVGILNTRTFLLDPAHDLESAMEFPSFVPESMNLLQLLRSLQRQRRGLAIVLDEFGGTAGLVTTEDILEEIVGQLHRDSTGQKIVLERVADGRWKMTGSVRLDDFRREHPELPDLPGIETMGGLLTHLLGIVPAQGQSATFAGLKLTATAVDDRRVHELAVENTRRKT